MATLDKVLQEARELAPSEQLRLIRALCEELSFNLAPQVISLEGRWAELPFDEEEIDKVLQELHRLSWQHLEEEVCEE